MQDHSNLPLPAIKPERRCEACDGPIANPQNKRFCSVGCKNKGLRKAVYDDVLGCEVRECTKCGETKPLDQFNKQDKTRHRPYCRECQSSHYKGWRESRPEQERERQQKWYYDNTDHVYQYNRKYRKRAIPASRVCLGCGDQFRPNSLEGRYCSTECAGAAVVKMRRESGEFGMPFTTHCQECGALIVDSPSRSDRKFCSRECAWPAKMRSMAGKSPSSIEQAVYSALAKIGIEYLSQHVIGIWVVDVYIPSENMVIECQGDYWHCNPRVFPDGPMNDIQKRGVERDRRRREWFRKHGYRYVEIWESDINAVGADHLVSEALKPE